MLVLQIGCHVVICSKRVNFTVSDEC